MRIVTWNINSLRLRMELVRRFVQQEQPDVLCLQEIKVDDPLFPMEDVKGLGDPLKERLLDIVRQQMPELV